MAVRLLVSDVDGTLVREDKSLSDAVVDAIARVRAQGVRLALISARPPSGLKELVERLQLDTPYAAFNGGTILSADGTVTSSHWLPASLAERALAAIDRPGVIRWWFREGRWFAERVDEVYAPLERVASRQEPIVGSPGKRFERIDKIVAVSDDATLLGSIERELHDGLGAEAAVVQSQVYFVDITAAAANKGDGAAALAAALGVAMEDVVTIGDQRNDLAMFARSGSSIAMGQAPEPVKRAATFVTDSNAEDGFASAMERFVLPMLR